MFISTSIFRVILFKIVSLPQGYEQNRFWLFIVVLSVLSHDVKLWYCLFLSHTESWLPLKRKLKINVKKAKWKSGMHGSEAIKRERKTIMKQVREKQLCVFNYRQSVIFLFCLLWYFACFLIFHVSHSNDSVSERRWTRAEFNGSLPQFWNLKHQQQNGLTGGWIQHTYTHDTSKHMQACTRQHVSRYVGGIMGT